MTTAHLDPTAAAPFPAPARAPLRPLGGIRVARGEQVIGTLTQTEIREKLADRDLLPSDSFYDGELSEWLPLQEWEARRTPVARKAQAWPCYCGSGLPFRVCCVADDEL